jgi:GNAT superfamily N-acetyltransferase
VSVRERREEDLPGLERILQELEADGHPPHRPREATRFLAAPNEMASFVFELNGEVVGHVAVHEYSARSVMAVASEGLNRPVGDFAAVARLFVASDGRRRGVGRALLDCAAAAASLDLGRHPILDVWNRLSPAIGLYESAGWARVGAATINFRSICTPACVHDGSSIDSFVYAFSL